MRPELFDVSRRWPRQRTPSDDEISFREPRNLLTVFCSIRRPYITFKLPRGDMDTPPCLRNFFLYLAIGICHFRDLWNGMCDRHRAEITVMQFRGHSLPVYQSMSVSWDFFPCPILLARSTYAIFPHKCHRNVSLPSGASLWNGKFGRVEGQNTTSSPSDVEIGKYPFITINHRYTLTRIACTGRGPFSGSNTSVCKLFVLGIVEIILRYANKTKNLRNYTQIQIWKYNVRISLTYWHNITPDGLKCH